MVETVKSSLLSRQSALADLIARRNAGKSSTDSNKEKPYTPKGREVFDTVDVGNGKMVNVARGLDLAAQVRAEKDPEKVRQMVKDGTKDILRIGRLFQQVFVTMRGVFGR